MLENLGRERPINGKNIENENGGFIVVFFVILKFLVGNSQRDKIFK